MAHLDLGVFSLPGPLTFGLFAHGFQLWNALWLAVVLIGTGIAGLYGQLPGVEPAPYILRFDEDRPNPLYRRVCYTFAWNAVLNFALLNLAGLAAAAITGSWHLKQIYLYAYSPLCAFILLLGMLGKLPRVGLSTKGEGTERRYFYGSVWAATASQTILLVLWKALPETREANQIKLIVYVGMLVAFGLARRVAYSRAPGRSCPANSWPIKQATSRAAGLLAQMHSYRRSSDRLS